ncbi:MAG: diaminopimelate decarboxylase [Methanomicrobiales archaeon]|nr:diaminopimelate decarboxylase [Methanomicrobiales archaeon]NYT20194.1 diaminopimelate decarboxylase [Methanomicrobiales archaeon]
MNLPPHLTIRGDHLWIGEHDTTDLARTWGTPLYVTDQDRIAACYAAYRDALTAEYSRVRILYAAKANGNLAVLRTLAGLGAGADVFSSGELHLALSAGMPPGTLLFNGSSKSRSDLALAVEKKVPVSVDSLDELRQLDAVAALAGTTARIAFRVNPAIDVPTHPKIATGLATSKFGIAHNLIPSAYREALDCPHIDPVGIHCHIGSQILAVEPFARACEVMMRIVGEITDLGVGLEFVDLGGGLGIPYHRGDGERAPSPHDYARAVVPLFREGIREAGISPELWIEPGRSLVADSTILLAGVNSVKPAHRTFVNVDAGFNLLVRPAMYDSWHEVIAANKAGRDGTVLYTIAGPICETGDILAHDRMLPGLASGDLIAVLDAGAYGFAMSSQYNSRPRCPEVILNGGKAALMRRGEDIADLTRTMETPPWQEPGH